MCGLALILTLPILANAVEPEDYRFPREPATTEGGYPLPLTGQPITKTPVISKTDSSSLKKYPEHYVPGKETLEEDEIVAMQTV